MLAWRKGGKEHAGLSWLAHERGLCTWFEYFPYDTVVLRCRVNANRCRVNANRCRVNANRCRVNANRRRVNANRCRVNANRRRVNANRRRVNANRRRVNANRCRVNANRCCVNTNRCHVNANRCRVNANRCRVNAVLLVHDFVICVRIHVGMLRTLHAIVVAGPGGNHCQTQLLSYSGLLRGLRPTRLCGFTGGVSYEV